METNKERREEAWKGELRDFVDKVYVPRKVTMRNLDRELIVDFVGKLLSSEYKRGREEAKKILVELRGLEPKQLTGDSSKEVGLARFLILGDAINSLTQD